MYTVLVVYTHHIDDIVHTILMTLYTPYYSVNKPLVLVGCKHQKPCAICDKMNTPIWYEISTSVFAVYYNTTDAPACMVMPGICLGAVQ